jgi:hypothetical protein
VAKEFKVPKFQDFEIVDNGEVVGALRVKASGIMWSPKGEHSWYGVTMSQFGDFAVNQGKKQKKYTPLTPRSENWREGRRGNYQ